MIGLLGDGPDRDVVRIAAVAGFTIVADSAVREDGRRCEGRIGEIVARETVLCRRQVRGRRLAGGDVAIVAEHAIVDVDARVRIGHIRKIRGVVAIHAILVVGIGRNVIRQLAQGNHVVVAGVATVGNTRMVISAGSKRAWIVANAAILDGRHVGGVHTVRRA